MPASTEPLRGKEVSFTGRLAAMTRREAMDLVIANGGRFAEVPRPETDYVVIGEEGWPLQADGRLTRKLSRAKELQQEGVGVAIIGEEVFLRMLGLDDRCEQISGLYTTGHLGRILGLRGSTIRAWVRSGLIEPATMHHRLAYFDFRQIAGAKALCDLVRAGVAIPRIRKSIVQLRTLRVVGERALLQLALIERDGRLLARLQGGGLVEPSGQLIFDFSPEGGAETLDIGERIGQAEWFDRALDYEEEGCFLEADRAYEAVHRSGPPMPEACFNHGNVLYGLGKREDALARFRQALGLDPEYVEAWNNLANVLAELGRIDEAVTAYRQALAIEPLYADAHYNLAETLYQAGDLEAAAPHWRAYLKQDPRSAWAREAVQRLALLEKTS